MQSDYEVKLLIVADDSDTLSMLGKILMMIFPKATLHTARDSREGLDLFNEHEPDIVLIDFARSEINGGELAKEIHAIKSEKKVIVITCDSEPIRIKASTRSKLAADHYIVKPVNLRELQGIIVGKPPIYHRDMPQPI